MAKKEDMQEEEGVVVVMTDEDGNEYYYEEEMIIPVGDEKYALLIGIHNDEDGHDHCINSSQYAWLPFKNKIRGEENEVHGDSEK